MGKRRGIIFVDRSKVELMASPNILRPELIRVARWKAIPMSIMKRTVSQVHKIKNLQM